MYHRFIAAFFSHTRTPSLPHPHPHPNTHSVFCLPWQCLKRTENRSTPGVSLLGTNSFRVPQRRCCQGENKHKPSNHQCAVKSVIQSFSEKILERVNHFASKCMTVTGYTCEMFAEDVVGGWGGGGVKLH